MNDLYLIPNSTVLKNLLGITNEKELDLAEVELSRANMMLLYENGFSDFSSGGFCFGKPRRAFGIWTFGKILLDAICIEPVEYANGDIKSKDKTDKYEKYKSKNYTPTKHEYIEWLKSEIYKTHKWVLHRANQVWHRMWITAIYYNTFDHLLTTYEQKVG